VKIRIFCLAKPVIHKRNWAWTAAARRFLLRISGRSAPAQGFHSLKTRTVVPLSTGASLPANDPLCAKLDELHRAFEGASELCYFHAELIVRLRRGIDVAASWETFARMWDHERDFLCANLNSRWLISALDTFADHGDPTQQARALIQIAFFNSIRIAQTERVLVAGEDDSGSAVVAGQSQMHELWDGIETYNFRRGDVVWNMLARIRRALDPDPILSKIFATLLQRALQHDTLIGRAARISEHPRREVPNTSDS
jgi:hypothetical protein